MAKANLQHQSEDAAQAAPPPLYSRHILFFPFQWQVPGGAENPAPGSQIQRVRAAVESAGRWKPAGISRQTGYSEMNYLHDFATGAVFEHPAMGGYPSVYNYEWRPGASGVLAHLSGDCDIEYRFSGCKKFYSKRPRSGRICIAPGATRGVKR